MALNTIFISHLPIDTLPSDIEGMLKKFGLITNIVIPPIQKSKPQFRYAFIRFNNPRSQKNAVLTMDGLMLEGRKLRVQPAKKDKPNQRPHQYTTPRTTNQNPPSNQITNSYPSTNQPCVIPDLIRRSPSLQPKKLIHLHSQYQKTPTPPLAPIYHSFKNLTLSQTYFSKTFQKQELQAQKFLVKLQRKPDNLSV